jgi:hypothetical protein
MGFNFKFFETLANSLKKFLKIQNKLVQYKVSDQNWQFSWKSKNYPTLVKTILLQLFEFLNDHLF